MLGGAVTRGGFYRLLAAVFAGLAALQVMVLASPGFSKGYLEPADVAPAITPGSWSGGLDLRLEYTETVSLSGRLVDVYVYTFSLKPGSPECRVYLEVYPGDSRGWTLLLHGLGGDAGFWLEGMGGAIAARLFNESYSLAILELAGHGRSCAPRGDWKAHARSLSDATDFFLYYVYLSALRAVDALGELGAEKVTVVGVSLGGMAALVLASLHPLVSEAIVIYAAGCITCMIESGGLANFIGDPDAGLQDEGVVRALSSLDPLVFVRSYGADGKTVWLIAPTHDEYFPLESFEETFRALRASGALAGFIAVRNGSHYSAPEWLADAIVSLIEEGGVEGLDGSLWRLGAKGLAYLPGPSWTPPLLVAPTQLVASYLQPTGERGLVVQGPAVTVAPILAALWAAGSVVAARRGDVAKPWLLLLAAVAAALILAVAPMYGWPGRFTLSALEVAERYSATLSAATGLPSVELVTLGVLVLPVAAAGVVSASSRLGLAAAVLAYIVAGSAVYGLLRLTVSAAASTAVSEGFESRLIVYPSEALLALVLLASLAARKLSREA